jgi:hypothetical protein
VLLPDTGLGRIPGAGDAAIFAFDNALAETWRLLSFDSFEPHKVKGAGDSIGTEDFCAVQALLGPVMVLGSNGALLLSNCDGGIRLQSAVANYRNALGIWLSGLAERMAGELDGGALEEPPDEEVVVSEFERDAEGAGRTRLIAEAEWYRKLGQRTRTLNVLARNKLMPPQIRSIGKRRAEA